MAAAFIAMLESAEFGVQHKRGRRPCCARRAGLGSPPRFDALHPHHPTSKQACFAGKPTVLWCVCVVQPSRLFAPLQSACPSRVADLPVTGVLSLAAAPMAAALSSTGLHPSCTAPAARPSSSTHNHSPWRPDCTSQLRCQPAAACRRTLLLQLAVCAAQRPSRLNAATFQAPSVSFLPPSSNRTTQATEVRAAVPKHHTGPPVYVQATGRIIASESPVCRVSPAAPCAISCTCLGSQYALLR